MNGYRIAEEHEEISYCAGTSAAKSKSGSAPIESYDEIGFLTKKAQKELGELSPELKELIKKRIKKTKKEIELKITLEFLVNIINELESRLSTLEKIIEENK